MRPRLSFIVFFAVVLSGTLLSGMGLSVAASEIDATSRTAVISAYPPEWKELQAALKNRKSQIVNGTEYVTGEIEGKPVLLFLSGISMINAAMTTQFVLDHFRIDRIVFSGVAGGLNPDLKLGDVVVPGQWSEYLEATLDVLNRTSRLGFVFNSLTIYSDSDKMRDDLYYADPCTLFDFCKRRYSRNVALLHDYDLYDFTILVRKTS